ncbi:MAG: primosomal protein N' [Acidobacteriia bacterium]|nr:primosomal protein N' [Terriglobia bacterium]
MTTFVDVAVPLGVRKTFAYSVPPALTTRVAVGARVLVPFGRKLAVAFVVGCSTSPPAGDFRIRSIRDVIGNEPALPPALVELALWVADYYFTAPGEILRAFLPAGSVGAGERKVRLSARTRDLISGGLRPPGLHPKEELLLETLAHAGEMSLKKLAAHAGLSDAQQWMEGLVERGLLQTEDYIERARITEKTQLGIKALPAEPETIARLTGAQREMYAQLRSAGGTLALQAALRLAGGGPGIARALEKKGLAEIAPMQMDRVPLELSEIPSRKLLVFTPAQREAFARLRTLVLGTESVRCLLHGVTGSGKTEIYLRLIAEVLQSGNTAMLLVPEIGLTPMLSRIAASHFPDRVALLHSGMSPGERFDQWNRIRSGAAQVVVGTRSAVFAPMEKLRLIVIDEEQDASYKQDESPCYHAREVAWRRLQRSGGVLLMGSATPSVETFYHAQDGSDVLRITLPERIEARPLPKVAVVDMSIEFQRHGRKTVVSERLRGELEENLRRGEQSIVLLNRRGYSRSLLCRGCGNVFSCPDCSISMTYHQKEGRLICHYCGIERKTPSACSSCGGEYIYFVGVGTEQLEEILRNMFPGARLARVDRDTTRRRGALRKLLFDFAAHKLDMLVGTQILAKGHDFPDVTLVGVVSADAGLSFPDFRSAERTFQLLTQVSGRAGRGQVAGRVVIQSFYPDHYALQFARRQDYCEFHRREIEFRRLLGYPPFRRLVQILISAGTAEKGLRIGEKVAEEVKSTAIRHGAKSRVQVLGPAAAPLERLRGRYRFQVLLKAEPGEHLSSILQEAFTNLGKRKVPLKSIHVDVDPLSLL